MNTLMMGDGCDGSSFSCSFSAVLFLCLIIFLSLLRAADVQMSVCVLDVHVVGCWRGELVLPNCLLAGCRSHAAGDE